MLHLSQIGIKHYRRRSQRNVYSFLLPCADKKDYPYCCTLDGLFTTRYEQLVHAIWPQSLTDDEEQFFNEKISGNNNIGEDCIFLIDIKEIVLFHVLNDISPIFLDFFWTSAVDKFLRALIVYFQYFIQVWELIKYRTENRNRLLRHPSSHIREEKWRKSLTILRYIVAREYCAIINGDGDVAKFHHMGKDRHENSKTKIDNLLFELLYRYSRRIVEIALCRQRDPCIYDEMARLFRPTDLYRIKGFHEGVSQIDKECLQDNNYMKTVPINAPVALEPYRPAMNLKLRNLARSTGNPLKSKNKQVNLLQLMYACSETEMKLRNIRVGILGLSRTDFDVMFNPNKNALKFTTFDKLVANGNETMTPPIFDNLPQKYEGSDFLVFEYNKDAMISKWRNYLKIESRLKKT